MNTQHNGPNGQRRRRIFADLGVQGELLKHVFLHWVGFLLATAVILVFIEMLSGSTGGMARVRRMHAPTLVAILALAPIFARDMVRFSHRFVGPIVRLRREIHELANGKTNPPLKFRDNDYWQELAVDFNEIAQQLAEAKSEIARLEAGRTKVNSQDASNELVNS